MLLLLDSLSSNFFEKKKTSCGVNFYFIPKWVSYIGDIEAQKFFKKAGSNGKIE